jgi:UDP-3-O-acyl-N-acetylglucosamine deacetylase
MTDIETEITVYNKGDIIESEPMDELYIKYNTEYNSVTPLFEGIRKAFSSLKNE